MSQVMPSFWPAVDQDGLKLAPLKRGASWLAVLKVDPQVRPLNPHEEETVLRLGFQKGQNGRYIMPGIPTGAGMQSLASLFGGEVAPLDPANAVFLESAERLQPPIPDALRQGIAWWWGHNRQRMIGEIRQSLRSSDDEQAKSLLTTMPANQWRNPDQLRTWIDQAFSGELTAVTEPILGMGLAKAAQLFGGELPDDLEQWRRKLAEYRGDPEPDSAELGPVAKALEDDQANQRPPVGTVVHWNDTKGSHRGRVVRLSNEESDAMWVASDQPKFINGMPLPVQSKVRLEQLVQNPLARPVTEPREPAIAGASKRPMMKRWTISVDDIPNEEIRNLKDTGRLSDEAREVIRAGIHTGAILGRTPLIADTGERQRRMVTRWGAAGEYLGETLGGEETPEVLEAQAFIRDDQIAKFNALQPEVVAVGVEPTLAVIPVPAIDFSHKADYRNAETRGQVLAQEVYAIGIHPMAAADLAREFKQRIADTPLPEDRAAFDDAFEHILGNCLQPERLEYSPLAQRLHTAPLTLTTRDYWLRSEESDDPETVMRELSHGRLSRDPAVMQQRLAATFEDKAQLPQDLLQSNTATLNSIATLAGKSRHSLEKLNHPLFVLADTLEARGIMEGWSRAEQLTGLGFDLQQDFKTIGQMASIAGARLVQLHEERLHDSYLEDGGMQRDLRAVVASGLVVNEDGYRAFTLGLASTNQSVGELNPHASMLGFNEVHAGQSPIESLGKLGALAAMQPLRFSEVMPDGVITQKIINELDPTWHSVPDLSQSTLPGFTYRAGSTPIHQVESHGLAVPEFPKIEGGVSNRDLMEAAGNTAKGLQTLTEAWRKDQGKVDQVKESLRLWASEHKHLQKMMPGGQENFIDNTMKTLMDQGVEMVVIQTRRSSRNIFIERRAVTARDIRNAGFDRDAAAEMASANLPNRRGSYTRAFDAMSALKPEALRHLNEMKAEEEKRRQQEAKQGNDTAKTPGKRGARQNRGLVAGLSVKDMRGNAATVLSNLTNASAEDQAKMTQKTRLWEAPDWVSLRSPQTEGEQAMQPQVALFWSLLRKDMPSKSPANVTAVNELYAQYALGVRDQFDKVRTMDQLAETLSTTGDLHTLIQDTRRRAGDLDIAPKTIIGDRLSLGADYGLRTFLELARRGTDNNTTWPRELGQTRRAAASQGEQYGAMPALKKLVRNGEDYRNGIDTDEETLLRTFGFSGVEYGESMPQRERTEYLNHAYDGFMDLSRVLNVDPQALSLGGSLGLAFGSRGRGGRRAALAHFEPSNNVINLTRLKGAGSMAHEYGHALANYFHRMTSGQVRGSGDLTTSIGNQKPIKEMTQDSLGHLRKPIHDAFALIMASIKYKPSGPVGEGDELSLDTFDQSRSNLSTLQKDAYWTDNDSRSRSSEGYWATPHELFARSFETWVNHRLDNNTDGKFRNDFLVRPDKLEAWGTPMEEQAPAAQTGEVGKRRPQLYPSGQQLEVLDKAFGRLVKEIKVGSRPVQHEHLGEIELPYMYSHDTGSIERLSVAEMGAVAQSVIGEVARMCGEQVEVAWEKELKDDAGSLVAGRFSVIEGTPQRPGYGLRGLIELAYGAPASTAYHEAFHYAQAALLTREEQQVLDHEFSPGQPLHDRLVVTLADQGKEDLIEQCQDTREAQAYAYQEWVKGSLDLKVEEQPRTLFGQIKDFCKKVFGIGKESGFKEPQSLFSAFYDGRLAARQHLEASMIKAQEATREQQAQSQKEEQSVTDPNLRERSASLGESAEDQLHDSDNNENAMYRPA